MFEPLLILALLGSVGIVAGGLLLAAVVGKPGLVRGSCGLSCGVLVALLVAGGAGTALALAAARGVRAGSLDWRCEARVPTLGSPFQGLPRGLQPPRFGRFSPLPDLGRDFELKFDCAPGPGVSRRLERSLQRVERRVERSARRLERRLERVFD